ncbi:MAG: penicillin acylase family protein [Candidatus Hodarchaeota archaeon]
MRKRTYILFLSVTIIIGFLPMIPTLAGNSNEILIVRDNYGVPHIFADTKEGLAFGAGYAMAQDRLWQADLYRRDAFGSLAEFGFASIDSDYRTRTLGYSKEELLEIFNKWVPTKPEAKLKEMMLAYAEGINQYIYEAQVAAAGGDLSLLPIEYLLLDLLPIEPFTIEDCVAIVVMMAWRFGGTGGGELSYASAFQALNATYDEETAWAIFNDQFPQVDPGAPTTIPSKGSHYPKGPIQSSVPTLPDNIDEIYEQVLGATKAKDQLSESLGLPTKFGSNAWMVRPKKSLTGNAMQVGGPQMGHTIPQIVLEVGLHGAGINAVGMMMPHAPTILIGASDFGAWTSTTGSSDLIDTYIEVLYPENPYQYWYNGEWVDMEKRTERIYGYKKMWYEDRDIYRTIHGPIRAWDIDNNLCYSMKADYYMDELAAEEGWSLFQQSRSISDFEDATRVVTAGHNFFWIDRRGNIGYWHCGAFPKKPITGKDGRIIDDRFPLWGTGEEEWVGVTGFDEIPKCINPAQGYLANWNNKPIADWPYKEADWGEVHGVQWIQEQLATGGKISFEDMNSINRDTGYAHYGGMHFLDFLVNAAKNDPSIPLEVIEALESWNWHYNDEEGPSTVGTYDDPGLTIFDKWFSMVDEAVFDDDLPYIGTFPYITRVGGDPSALLHVFDGENSKLPLNYDYLNGEDRDALIVDVLKDALAELETTFGPDVSTWLTPVRTTRFSPQGFLFNPAFGQPELRMHSMNRGTYNHIVEMPRWKWKNLNKQEPTHGVNVIPPGQSGFMNIYGQFDHVIDQLPLYETWTYKPMRFRFGEIWDVAESWMFLSY